MAMQRRGAPILWAFISIIAIIAVGGVVAIQWASSEIKHRITEVLGPNGSAEQIEVGFHSIHLTKVRLGAPSGWPTTDALRAERIDIEPDWRAWFSHRLHLKSVDVDGFYESALRTKDGKLIVLPGLKENIANMAEAHQEDHPSANDAPRAPLAVQVDQIALHHGQLDFYDEKIASPPFPVHMDAFNAMLTHVDFPGLTSHSTIQIAANLGGGKLALDGWTEFATRDAQIAITLSHVDAKTLEPYLLHGQKATIQSGTVDMTMNWNVASSMLHAPGRLTLSNLQIQPKNDGPASALSSISKKAAIAALKDDNGRIDINFELEGNLRDPKFSIDEDWYKRVGTGFAKAAGVSVEDVGKNAGDAAKNIGNALKGLIGH